jgi:hypothetical protein
MSRFGLSGLAAVLASLALVFVADEAAAQPVDHSQHQQHGTAAKTKQPAKKKTAPAKKQKHPPGHRHTPGMKHGTHDTHGPDATPHSQHGTMKAFFGPYPITREGSGTSWLPDTSPHDGIHASYGDWSLMWHALFNGVYDKQGGPRGGEKTFVNGMVMGMAQRPLGDGTFGLRAMLSPDPFMGPRGYPLLFAAGETADGRTLLVDRQHPHDLFMELAASYSYDLSATSSVFIYAGLPGEPALGPPAFMHRSSGVDIPEAPLTHHWLDSTHITFGVVTVGAVFDNVKIEGSAFRGREPDQHRFDIEAPRLDSFSGRFTWNPIREVSMQVSYGRIHSPEGLEPDVDEDRLTASATYTQPFGQNNIWSTTFAWGRKFLRPGDTLDAFMLESALVFHKTWTVFLRAERIDSHDLLHNTPGVEQHLEQGVFPVAKISVGGIYDFRVAEHLKLGIGGLVSKYGVPDELTPFYGSNPTSYMAFMRLKVS